MIRQTFLLLLFVFAGVLSCRSQCSFQEDSLFIPKENKIVAAVFLDVQLKKSSMQFIKIKSEKYFLRLVVTENLYFDKIDQLELQSGKKSFYAKDVKQIEVDKHSGYFLVELFKNYVATLKDDGLTAIVFNKAQTNFSKQETALVKQNAKCFYEKISQK
jgi:hypothetical protein